MPTILLSDLLDREVVEGDRHVGYVSDVRLIIDDPGAAQSAESAVPPARVYGLLVSPKRRASYLGYERSGVNSPWPIAWIARRLHRGTIMVAWSDVISIGSRIQLRQGFEAQQPTMDVSRLHAPSSHE